MLIAGRKNNHEFIEIYRERAFVKLGQDGLNVLSKSAYKRAFEAMRKFKQIIDLFETIDCRAYATAAFRAAQNAELLIKRVSRELEIDIKVISGVSEARLIYEGVRFGGGLQKEQNLIMDIGGGSVEFIVGDRDGVKWSKSFESGVSLLRNRFHHAEPISAMEQCELLAFLRKMLEPVREKIQEYQFNTLIGCAGTFDVLAEALPKADTVGRCPVVLADDYLQFYSSVLQMDLEERIIDQRIPENRADMIVVALMLLKVILDFGSFRYILISPFALKEGIIAEMFKAYKQSLN